MAYIQVNQQQLNDLSFSKEREILLVNRLGSYCSTTVSTCNTRKYHGLLVTPQHQLGDEVHVMLSGVDETIFSGDHGYALGVHQYPAVHFPEGQQFMTKFLMEDALLWVYSMNGIKLEKEIILSPYENRLMIRYKLLEGKGQVKLQVRPFLACRNVHTVRHAVPDAKVSTDEVPNGLRFQLFEAYEPLYFQHSKKGLFVLAPDWYHNIEYEREKERGYEYQESLFQPGYFEFTLKKGEEIVFSCSTHEANPRMLKKVFTKERGSMLPKSSFENCLLQAAEQFIVNHDDHMQVIAGWPWFGKWGRDTFIALPGLTLATSKPEVFKLVMNGMMQEMKDGFFPNTGTGEHAVFNAIDAPLWCIWALQQYAYQMDELKSTWAHYGEKIKNILEGYKNNKHFNTTLREGGLIWSGEENYALTWMDAIVDGYPVTGRRGMAVEINALWYNAVSFALEAAGSTADTQFVREWSKYPSLIQSSFNEIFWDEEKGYLADYVDEDHKNWSIRPNQIFAISLPFSPVNEEIAFAILDTVERDLLTIRGLRSLSPTDPAYLGNYVGDQPSRDKGYHQGTVWPWLLGHFAEAYLKLRGADAVDFIEELYNGFEPALFEYGLGTIAEVYDGDPPHKPGGTISQAWSVAELLRIRQLIAIYKVEAPDAAERQRTNKKKRKPAINT